MQQINALSSRIRHTAIAAAVFLLVFSIYMLSSNTHLSDSLWAVHVTSSLLNAGDIDLDEYAQIVEEADFYGVHNKTVNERLLPSYPIGNSILIIPLLWVIEQFKQFPDQQTFYEFLQQTSPRDPYVVSLQHLFASLLTALIAPIFYFIGRNQYGGIAVPIIFALIFALGTSAYSTASRVLWQHGPSMLMLAIGLLFLIKGKDNPRYIQLAGLPIALSYVVRPTNSISIIVFTAFVLFFHRKQLWGYLLSAAIVAIPFVWLNQVVYGSLLQPYYMPGRIGSTPSFSEALIGNLISPARGIFIFMPVLIFSLYGIYLKIKDDRFLPLDFALVIIIFLHWITISLNPSWWGGNSYGPRLFSDVLPYMIYFLLPVIHQLFSEKSQFRLRPILISIFVLLAGISITIQYVGANRSGIVTWYSLPVSSDIHATTRLWDWSDLQFQRTVDDWPLVASTPIIIDKKNYAPGDLIHIPIHNRTETAYLWEITTSSLVHVVNAPGIDFTYSKSGIPLVIGKNPLLANEYQWIPISIDTPLTNLNDFSLGSIVLKSKTLQGNEKSIQIIPLSVVNNEQDWRESYALDNRLWLPSDIHVNGTKPEPALYALFGAGWYALETLDQYKWRWAQSPAEMQIYSAKAQQVVLELQFSSFHDDASESGVSDRGALHILSGDQEVVLHVDSDQIYSVPLSLNNGWNSVVFRLESGNFRPRDLMISSDQRVLSLNLTSLNIVTVD